MIVCGIFAATQISLTELLRDRQVKLVNAKSELELALTETQLGLGARMSALAADAALARHLDWHLSHSVRGTLESRLAPGEVDRLVIMNDSCKELFQVGKGPHIDCARAQKAATAGLAAAFSSGDSENFERLALSIRIGSTLLIGDVALDDIWLGRHPRLKKQLEQAGLQIERMEKPIAASAIVVGESSGLRLVTKQALDRFFQLDTSKQSFTGGTPQFFNPLFWPTVAIGLICASLAVLRSWRRRLRLLHLISDHAEAIMGIDQAQAKAQGQVAADLLSAVRKHIESRNKTTESECQALRDKLTQADIRQKFIEEQRLALETRLAAQVGFESLAAQLQAATRPFLKRLQHLRDVVENLRDITNTGVIQTAHALSEQILAWHISIQERGSRKFIRSLAETPSMHRSEESALDDQLNQLLALANNLKDQSLHTNLSSQALLRETEEATKLATHWEALAAGVTNRERHITMAEALTEAYNLVVASGIPITSFDPGDAGTTSPSLPAQTAVSALYHLIASFTIAHSGGLRLACRMRQEHGRSLMIFSSQGDSLRNTPNSHELQSKHLETAATLLAPHHITLIILPTRSGIAPIALKWEETIRATALDTKQVLCLSAETQ